ncbi:hypothetical protein SBA5_120028 [Candidatus Sulfotelmatomonas gaucii]|uniref:Uncharacterized protein n=1 Tax=Candidatus Sulfuritelmatomonas gaucii TaxID=2043161 RepID=A0A2N9L3S1_9BACT|nr:hypothetical protein SBA5_120028 [Candidatus Sulfotelmatomonas gaucii]
MEVGITAHRVTKTSPPCNSRMKTHALAAMISAVTMAKRRERREAFPRGITVPTFVFLGPDEGSVTVLYHAGRRGTGGEWAADRFCAQ